MGVEITEVLNIIPMVLEVLRFIRQRMKAACTCSGTKIVIAEPPIRTIDKGLVTTEFIAAMLMNKYCDHLPMHRQVGRLLKSAKVNIAESSICRWRDQVAGELEPLFKLMKSAIKESYCINTDASPAPIRLPKEKNRIVSGNTYVYIGGNDAPYNIFDVQPNQSAKPMPPTNLPKSHAGRSTRSYSISTTLPNGSWWSVTIDRALFFSGFGI
ncbi:MAG: transposase [Planctomycetaceae bacterium]|nr:transposase [Planctomycetaceae bacterium]